jgi:hypothetical protein
MTAEQLAGSPVRMAVMGLEQALEQRWIESGRRAVGAPGLIGEAGDPEGVIAGQELVAGLPADAVRGTELGDGHHPPALGLSRISGLDRRRAHSGALVARRLSSAGSTLVGGLSVGRGRRRAPCATGILRATGHRVGGLT